jgi:glutamine amidotransferase
MCRLAAYLGEPLYLEELIAKPRHSLMRQAQHAVEAKVQINGDGFGIGWYGEREEPGVYREAMPAWSDDNLLALSQTLRSRLFFAHVRAATAGANSRHNCHPFRHGRHLFMHNGQIGGYATLRRTLESWLPDDLYAARRGATDSELLFLLAVARQRESHCVTDAMLSTLRDVSALMRERGVAQPLRFAATWADGERLLAFRFATDGKPPTLYLRRCGHGTMIASEPLCDGAASPADPAAGSEPLGGGWTLLPVGAMVAADSLGVSVVPTRLEHWADGSGVSTPAPACALGADLTAMRQPAGLMA